MKTSEDFLKEGAEGYPLRDVIDNIEDQDILNAMIEFAKYHVEQALKAASEKAKQKKKEIPYEGVRAGGSYYIDIIDKDSILNAYSLKNIK